jgi:hypothetical protein
MRIFVPVEDASVDAESGVLVPYRCGLACAHELRGALVLGDGVWAERPAISDESRSDRPTSIRAFPIRPR